MFELFRSFYLFSTGNYQKALETYKDIHRKFPENVECNSFYFQHRIILIFIIIINWWECEENINLCVCVFRSEIPGETVHRHGAEGGPGLRHQAEEGGEDEGDQRAGIICVLKLQGI